MIKLETQELVVAGLNIDNAAFPLHQKALGKYLDMVNGNVLKKLNHHTSSELEQIVNNLKNLGYLSEEFALNNTNENQKKRKP